MLWIFTVVKTTEGKLKGKMNLEISLPAGAEGWKWEFPLDLFRPAFFAKIARKNSSRIG
jgi:hypothetical protein